MATGNRVRLSRGQLRSPDRRGHPAHDRKDAQGVRSRRDRRSARSRCSDRRSILRTTTASPNDPATAAGPIALGRAAVRTTGPTKRSRVSSRHNTAMIAETEAGVAPNRGRQRSRQRTGPGAGAVPDFVGRQGQWRPAAPSGDYRPDLPGAVQRCRPGAVRPAALRYRVRIARSRKACPPSPRGRICWWGGWGGSMIVMNPDRARHVLVCDEQDGTRHHGHRANQPLCEADLRGSGLIPQRQPVEHVETHGGQTAP